MEKFNALLHEKFKEMCSSGKLFRSNLSGDKIWKIYLESFPSEQDPIFRDPSSTEHNCNHCKNFIRRYGNIVSVDSNNKLVTIFDVVPDEEYVNSAREMANAIKNSKIANVFFETFDELNSLPYESCTKSSKVFKLGVDRNTKRYTQEEAEKYGVVKPNETRTFHHFHLFLPHQYVDTTGRSVESIMGDFRSDKEVFKRAMDEISLDTFNLVRELIPQGSLLDGTTHLHKLEKMIPLKEAYDKLAPAEKDNWCWVNSYKFPLSKFKNELIGVLCSELAEGEDLNKACQSWNKRVDPANYMKTTAPITQKQINEAKTFVEENGYLESFSRRMALIDDIKASEIKHISAGDGTIKTVSIFDGVKSTKSIHKRNEFDKVEEIGIEKFMKDIIPTCSSIELYLENRQSDNMVTLTTSVKEDSKPIFKWGNNYSWTFNGNLAGKSQIKQAVKDAGGNVDGVLNFRLAWNEKGGTDHSDLDAWAQEPNGTKIGFSTGYRKDRRGVRTSMSGQLDVDNTNPGRDMGVENITWIDKSKMKDGVYKFWVNQYSSRGSKGFQVEIEFDGEIYQYEYKKPVTGNVQVAEVILEKGIFTIKHLLPETNVSREIYGLSTNEFHKVNLVCLSPNHWGENNVGNKHYFFMLEGAKSPTSIRSFHNENLSSELEKHKRVMEVLGTTNMVPSIDKQLSGVGFNSTVRDEVILKLSGTFKRIVKIKF